MVDPHAMYRDRYAFLPSYISCHTRGPYSHRLAGRSGGLPPFENPGSAQLLVAGYNSSRQPVL